MSAHLTDEEQLEALKRWWKEYGSSTMASIAIALAGYFGWQFWQNTQQANAEAASAVYQQMMEATQVQAGEGISEESAATARHLAGELKSQYGSSLYAQQAGLLLAKLAVEANNLDLAATELNWVLEQNPEQGVVVLTRLRLAKVRYAQEDYDQVLVELKAVEPGAFVSAYEELKGDALLVTGSQQEAKASYQLAFTSLLEAEGARRELLQMKLDDLKIAVNSSGNTAESSKENGDEPSTEVDPAPAVTPSVSSAGEDV